MVIRIFFLIIGAVVLIQGHSMINSNCEKCMDILMSTRLIANFLHDVGRYTRSKTIYIVTNKDNSGITMKTGRILFTEGFMWFRIHVFDAQQMINTLVNEKEKPVLVLLMMDNLENILPTMKQVINNRQIEANVSWLILTCDLRWVDFDEDLKPTPNTRILLAKPSRNTNCTFETFSLHLGFVNIDYQINKLHVYYLGLWKSQNNLKTSVKFEYCCFNLTGLGLRIVYLEDDFPYMVAEYTNGDWEFSGIIGEIFTIFAKFFGTKLKKVYSLPRNSYGNTYSSDNTTSLVEELHTQRADISLSTLAETKNRSHLIDFSKNIGNNKIVAIYKKRWRKTDETLLSTLCNGRTWFAHIIFSGSAIVMWLLIKVMLRIFEINERFTLLSIWGRITNQGINTMFLNFSVKIMEFTILVCGVLLCQFYGSALTSNKISETEILPFETFSDLASNSDYTLITTLSSAVKDLHMESKHEDLSKLGRTLYNKSKILPFKSYSKIAEILNNSKAVFLTVESKFIKFQFKKDFTMMQSADGIEFAEHIGFQKSSPLTRIFNLFIQHITESGIMSRITSKKKYSKQLNHRQADQKLIEPIEVSQIFISILMIITSVSVSFMIVFTERIFHKRNTNNK